MEFSKPTLIVVTGLQGSGKSYLSSKLSEHYHLDRISSDQIRNRFFNRPEIDTNARYSQGITEAVFELMHCYAELAVLNQKSILLDGIFFYPPGWQNLKDICNRTNAVLTFIFIEESEYVIRERLLNRKKDPYFSEADIQVFEKSWRSIQNNGYPYENIDFKKLEIPYIVISTENKKILKISETLDQSQWYKFIFEI